MSRDTFMTKRRAKYAGEVGFFADDEMAEEDIRPVTMNQQVIVKGWYSPKTLEKQRFLWGVVYKTWQNTDIWLDHHKAMDAIKAEVHFTQMLWDRKEKKLKEHLRSITRISDSELRFLTERIIDHICAEILPGIDRDDLRREVEEMLGDRKQT